MNTENNQTGPSRDHLNNNDQLLPLDEKETESIESETVENQNEDENDGDSTTASEQPISETISNDNNRDSHEEDSLVIKQLLGDMNLDGVVDQRDADPFVLALNDPEEYQRQYGVPATFNGTSIRMECLISMILHHSIDFSIYSYLEI